MSGFFVAGAALHYTAARLLACTTAPPSRHRRTARHHHARRPPAAPSLSKRIWPHDGLLLVRWPAAAAAACCGRCGGLLVGGGGGGGAKLGAQRIADTTLLVTRRKCPIASSIQMPELACWWRKQESAKVSGRGWRCNGAGGLSGALVDGNVTARLRQGWVMFLPSRAVTHRHAR